MDFIEKVGSVVTEKGKVAVEKAQEVAEIVTLKAKISTKESMLRKKYAELGKLYFEQYGTQGEDAFAVPCSAIYALKDEIAELRNQINEIKDV